MINISHDPKSIVKGVQTNLKLKDEKLEDPNTYISSQLFKMDKIQGGGLWDIPYDKYCASMVNNVE